MSRVMQPSEGSIPNSGKLASHQPDPDCLHPAENASTSLEPAPDVFVFNPFTEGRIAHGSGFTPTKPQAQLGSDLSNLPQFLCGDGDVVLVEREPSPGFLQPLLEAGFPRPEFVDPRRIGDLAQRNLGRLRPWAWGPDSVALFKPLFRHLTSERRTMEGSFNPGILQLYSKAWSADLLKRLIERSPPGFASWLCGQDTVGVAVETLEHALRAIAVLRNDGSCAVVAKEALGVAGANAIRMLEPELLPEHRRWMENAIAHAKPLVIEPWLDRTADFSVQLDRTESGLKLRGFTGLITGKRGQFRANWVAPDFNHRIPAQILERLENSPRTASKLHGFYDEVIAALEPRLREVGFLGPLGIDAFVYRASDGRHLVKPIVEINPRYTMGRLALELMRRVSPGSYGVIRLINRNILNSQKLSSFVAYADRLRAAFPLSFEETSTRRIREGALVLNDPALAEACLAVFQVSSDFKIVSAAATGLEAA